MADLGISIALNSTQYTQGLATVQQQTNAATASISRGLKDVGQSSQQSGAAVSAFTSNLGGLGGVLSGGTGTIALAGLAGAAVYKFGEAILAVSKESIEIASKVQGVNRALGFAAGSADAGAEAYGRFKKTANELGISIEANQVAYKNFIVSATQSGQTMNAAEKEFKQVAIAMTAMGLSAEDSNGVLLALGQIASKGTVSAEELRGQIGERLPGAFAIAARSIGVTEQQLNKMLEQGQVISKDFLPKFTQELENTFGSAAQAGVGSYAAKLNIFNNQIFELKNALGEELLPVMVDFLNAGKDIINVFGGAKSVVGGVVESVKSLWHTLTAGFGILGGIKDLLGAIGINTNVSFNKMKEGANSVVDSDDLGKYYREKEGDVAKFTKSAVKSTEKIKKAAKELAQEGSLGFFEEQLKKINETFQNKKLSGGQITDLLGKKEDVEAQIKRLKELYGIIKAESEPAAGSMAALKKQLSEIQKQINESPNDLGLLTGLQKQAISTQKQIEELEKTIFKAKRAASGETPQTIQTISNLPSQGLTDFSIPTLQVPKADTSGLDDLIKKFQELDLQLLSTETKVIRMFGAFKESAITGIGESFSELGKGIALAASGAATTEQVFQQFLKDTLNAVFVSAPRLLGLNLLKEALTTPPPASWAMIAGGVALLGISGLAGGLISQIGQQPESIATQAGGGTQQISTQTQQAVGLSQVGDNNFQNFTQVTVVLETNGIISEIQKQEYINGQLRGQ